MTFIYGRSVNGVPLEGVTLLGSDSQKPLILLFAGIHGDERTTVVVMRRFVEYVSHQPQSSSTLVVVPLANPDGYAADTRVNARGVDLNRNFPATNFKPSRISRYANGSAPLCEPESRALFDLVQRLKPARILSLHAIQRSKHGNNYDGPAKEIADRMATQNHYNVLDTIGYATPGSFGSWAGIDQQIPTITLELPSNATAEVAWGENRDALMTFVNAD